MRTQPLSGGGNRVLTSIFVSCLLTFALPTNAKAADPAFSNPVCSLQQYSSGGATVWQIKGTVSVINLVPANAPVTVTVKFQKKAAGATDWSDMSSVTQYTSGVGGTASIDTGLQSFLPPPASGDQYRIMVSGSYATGSPPTNNPLNPVGSTPQTPIP